jgi:hypothetical protein
MPLPIATAAGRTKALFQLILVIVAATLLVSIVVLLTSPIFLLVGAIVVAFYLVWKFPTVNLPTGWFKTIRALWALIRVLPSLGPALIGLADALKAAAAGVMIAKNALADVQHDLDSVGNVFKNLAFKLPEAQSKSLKDLISIPKVAIPDVPVVTGIKLSDTFTLATVGNQMTGQATHLGTIIQDVDAQATILSDASAAIRAIGTALSPR